METARSAESPKEHWSQAARRWAQVGSPLRPCEADAEIFWDNVRPWLEKPSPRCLLLGVTPEVYHLPWPEHARLLAVDHTWAMIQAVWPGRRHAVICADWTQLPLPAAACEIVLCDGGIHLLSHPHQQKMLVEGLRRVLVPNGICIIRLFAPPQDPETPETVLADLQAGKIPNLNVLKLRLGAALQVDSTEGVGLNDVWQTLHRFSPDFAALAQKLGWALEHLCTIDTYKGSAKRYHFITQAELERLFCATPGGFKLDTIHVSDYFWGENTPILVFRRDDYSRDP